MVIQHNLSAGNTERQMGIVKGDKAETETFLKEKTPILFDILHLSLEEVFTYEMSALGYEFDDVLEVYDDEEN